MAIRRGPFRGPKARRRVNRDEAATAAPPPAVNYVQLDAADGAAASQRFTGTGAPLAQVTVSARSPANAGATIFCDIFAADVNGLPTGSSLAQSSFAPFDASLDPVNFAPLAFPFSGFTPALGTDYCFVVSYD